MFIREFKGGRKALPLVNQKMLRSKPVVLALTLRIKAGTRSSNRQRPTILRCYIKHLVILQHLLEMQFRAITVATLLVTISTAFALPGSALDKICT